MIARPWMAWAALVAALSVLLVIQTLRLAGVEKDHAESMRAFAEAATAAIDDALKTERQLRADMETIQAAAAKEMEDAKARENALIDSVTAGRRRLSVAAVCPGAAGPGSTAAGGSGSGVSRAELDPAAAGRILTIGRDGDEAIRERNTCIEAYEAVRKRVNSPE